MGTYKSKGIKIDADKLDDLEEIKNYEVKTRQPYPSSWKMNILRGKREDDLKDQAMPLARRKCKKKVHVFNECEKQEGKFWTVFNCQEEFQTMQECFDTQLNVEMDKLRTNMELNPEWWWRELYDENGEIGEQKKYQSEVFYKTFFKRFFN